MADAVPTKHFIRTAITGGTTGCMDSIDGASLEEGYTCEVTISTFISYRYRLNATSGAAESSPDTISPDTNAGNKRWILVASFNQKTTTDASPTFVTAKLSGLTDGYIPKHTSDVVGLANSPIYTDGTNVGIGTTVPTKALDVYGVITITDGSRNAPSGLATEGGSNIINFGVNEGNGNRFGTYHSSEQGGMLRLDIRSGQPLFQFFGRQAAVSGDVSSLMSVLSTGNVGIGTISPASLTEIQGGLTTTGAILTLGSKEPSTVAGDVLGRVNFYAPLDAAGTDAILVAGSIVAMAEDTFSASVNKTSLHFQTGASEVATTKMTVMSNGNVGIGTTGPNNKLAVTGSTGAASFRCVTAAYQSQLNVIDTTALAANTGGKISFMGIYTAGGGETEFGQIHGIKENATDGNFASALALYTRPNGGAPTEYVRITSAGNVGIGKTNPGYLLEVNTDSAGKPGVGGLWTVVSDERIKKDISLADLDRCYEIVKLTPLKRFTWDDGVYSEEQVKDQSNIGWVAQDVQKVFPKATNIKPFTKAEKIDDGFEEYEEQDFTVEEVEREETYIEVVNGKPTQKTKIVKTENKTMLFDDVIVVDEFDQPVMTPVVIRKAESIAAEFDEEGNITKEAIEIPEEIQHEPLTYQVPRMIKKTRPKFRQEVIEDCLDLNGGQMIAAMYGCIQKLQSVVEELQTKIIKLEGKK